MTRNHEKLVRERGISKRGQGQEGWREEEIERTSEKERKKIEKREIGEREKKMRKKREKREFGERERQRQREREKIF